MEEDFTQVQHRRHSCAVFLDVPLQLLQVSQNDNFIFVLLKRPYCVTFRISQNAVECYLVTPDPNWLWLHMRLLCLKLFQQ